jgi:hypothetical protein
MYLTKCSLYNQFKLITKNTLQALADNLNRNIIVSRIFGPLEILDNTFLCKFIGIYLEIFQKWNYMNKIITHIDELESEQLSNLQTICDVTIGMEAFIYACV